MHNFKSIKQLINVFSLRFFSWRLQLRPSCSCQLSLPSCPPSCGPLPPGPAWLWWRWCTGSPGSRPAWRHPGGSPPPWAGPGRWRGPEAGSAGSGSRAPGRTGWSFAPPGGGPAGGWPPGRPRRPRRHPSRRQRRRTDRPPGWTWEQRSETSHKLVEGNDKLREVVPEGQTQIRQNEELRRSCRPTVVFCEKNLHPRIMVGVLIWTQTSLILQSHWL